MRSLPATELVRELLPRRRALTAVLERYLDHQRTGHPVHTWPLPGPGGG